MSTFPSENLLVWEISGSVVSVGFASVEEFIGESKTRKTRSDKGVTFPPKYRDPSNPKKTWSGKGRKPNFVIKHLDGGGDLDDLLI